MQGIEPFWGEEPEVVRERVLSAYTLSPEDLVRFSIVDHRLSQRPPDGGDHFSDQIVSWFDKNDLAMLPDLTFLLNTLDEPWVVVPHDVLEVMLKQVPSTRQRDNPRKNSMSSIDFGKRLHDLTVNFLDLDQQENWKESTLSCSLD